MTWPSEIVEILKDNGNMAVLTGAGISAESGVPTFRGPGGYWKHHKPEDLATPQAFTRQPELVWEWYRYRRNLINQVTPNDGHLALARLETLLSRFTLITQNVDGLHQQAGSGNVIELHGSIMNSRCFSCQRQSLPGEEDNKADVPLCACGGMLRPGVVWFGESLPADSLHAAFRAAENADIFLAVGTSGMVQPAASLPLAALERGARVIEINTEATALSHMLHYSLFGQAGELLPQLVDALNTSEIR